MKRAFAILAVFALAFLAFFLAYWFCFAMWMTAYYTDPPLLRYWRVRGHLLFSGMVLVIATEIWLLIKIARSRRKPC